MDDPFIRQYVEDLLTKIRTQVREGQSSRQRQQHDSSADASACQSPGSLARFRLSVLPLCCLSKTFGPSWCTYWQH